MCAKPPILAAIALAIGLVSGPALAADAPENQRMSLQGFLGAYMIFPYAGFSLGYRLPVLDNRLEVYASVAPWMALPVSIGSLNVGADIGGRYYWAPLLDKLQPFAWASIGATAYYPLLPPGAPVEPKWTFNMATVFAGVGADWRLSSTTALSGSLGAGYPGILRPQVAFKLMF